jgi:hypothetical protein
LELHRNRSTADAFAGMINKQSNSRANARYGDHSDVAALVPRRYLGTVASKSNEVDAISITTIPRRVGHRIARRQFIKSNFSCFVRIVCTIFAIEMTFSSSCLRAMSCSPTGAPSYTSGSSTFVRRSGQRSSSCTHRLPNSSDRFHSAVHSPCQTRRSPYLPWSLV